MSNKISALSIGAKVRNNIVEDKNLKVFYFVKMSD